MQSYIILTSLLLCRITYAQSPLDFLSGSQAMCEEGELPTNVEIDRFDH